MRIVHKKIVDTSVVFPHRLGPPMKRALKTLSSEILQKIIQEEGKKFFIYIILCREWSRQ